MKQSILLTALGLAAFGASAQEVGNVVSSTPIVQQVQVPQQVCNNQPQYVQAPSSGGGALLGAIVGGVLGHQVGAGAGRAAATGVGAVVGAMAGNNIETNRGYATGPNCMTQTGYESRTVGYNVTYDYAGRQYTAQLPYDPGRTIALNRDGSPAAGQGGPVYAPQQQPQAVYQQQAPQVVYQQQPQVVYQQPYPVATYPAYPAYAYPVYPAYRPYYPPIGVSLGFVYGSGGHHHWR